MAGICCWSIVHPEMLGAAAAAALVPTGVSASPTAQSTAMMSLITRSKYGSGISRVKPMLLRSLARQMAPNCLDFRRLPAPRAHSACSTPARPRTRCSFFCVMNQPPFPDRRASTTRRLEGCNSLSQILSDGCECVATGAGSQHTFSSSPSVQPGGSLAGNDSRPTSSASAESCRLTQQHDFRG